MAIVRVQSITAATASATSLTMTFGANLTVGNLVVIAVANGSGTAGPDNIATATPANCPILWFSRRNTGGANSALLCFGRVNTAVAAIVNTLGTTTSCAMVGAEYSGVNLIGLDQGTTGDTGSGTNITAGSVTTLFANELIVSCVSVRGTSISAGAFNTPLPTGPPATAIVDQITAGVATSNADRAVALLERIVSSTGTTSPSVTSAVNNSWIGITASIVASTSSSGGGLRAAGHGGLAA